MYEVRNEALLELDPDAIVELIGDSPEPFFIAVKPSYYRGVPKGTRVSRAWYDPARHIINLVVTHPDRKFFDLPRGSEPCSMGYDAVSIHTIDEMTDAQLDQILNDKAAAKRMVEFARKLLVRALDRL